jgi:glycosyltransferase involved in cell wall biosynthesis
MRSLSILVAAYVPGARTGGMSRLMGFTHDILAEQGHRVTYLYAEEAAAMGVQGRLGKLTFPAALARHVRDRARRGQGYDIVNVHEPTGFWLTRGRSVSEPALVVTSHGLERRAWDLALEEARLGRAGPSLKTRITYPLTVRWQADRSLRGADHVLCLSSEDLRALQAWLGAACPPTTRIFPGVDSGYARASGDRDWRRADRLLFAGTWRKNKGIEDLVPAFAAAAAANPGLSLTILGGLADEDSVRAAFPSALRSRVRCVTAGSDVAAARVFAEHDLFVLPSLFEGTPLTLLEAMASGLPVVTTATCGMLDVVRDGVNGLLVPRRAPEAIVAALRRLQDDSTLRRQLGSAARETALREHTWERAAAPIAEAYESAILRHRERTRA